MTADKVARVLRVMIKLNEELDTQDFVESFFWMETDGKDAEIKFNIDGGGSVLLWDSADEDTSEWAETNGWLEDFEKFLREEAKNCLERAAEQLKHVKL